ncbi:MAG: DUF4091 domain-containing protein [Planctomycetes bacterium]|nr:DUF4091 domain-containing protein [Planctomycetota bacterium]
MTRSHPFFFLFLAMLVLSMGMSAYGQRKANPWYEPPLPAVTEGSTALDLEWEKVAPGLQGGVGSIDTRYLQARVPPIAQTMNWAGSGWRGERLSLQLVLWTAEPMEQVRVTASAFENDAGGLAFQALQVFCVRYTLGDSGLMPDILDAGRFPDMPAQSVRPLWAQVDIPEDAGPGIYEGFIRVEAKDQAALTFHLEVEVLPLALPPPSDWSFHLDLWQNPYAVARYHHVEPWSHEHFALLKPHVELLAQAGQKAITATIIHQPWGTQTFDPYESMVRWIRQADGTWEFDFTVFDQWVIFCGARGLDGAIHCYSTVPWTDQVSFFDDKDGFYHDVTFKAGDAVYQEIWTPFLKTFSNHLKMRGWTGRVYLAMDERPPDQMIPAIDLIRAHAPELKIALAGHNHPELNDRIDDWCVFITPILDPAVVEERTARIRAGETHLQTTFYVCCSPARPNTFTDSPPSEACWLGWYAAAQGYTGFLRWAFDSWVEDPFLDTRHVTWPAGDCFLVYPGARSSIRFERLREGIQDFEKIRILRERSAESEDPRSTDAMASLNNVLERFTFEAVQAAPASIQVRAGKAALDRWARVFCPDAD